LNQQTDEVLANQPTGYFIIDKNIGLTLEHHPQNYRGNALTMTGT